MEIALPIFALGGMYIMANRRNRESIQNNNLNQDNLDESEEDINSFTENIDGINIIPNDLRYTSPLDKLNKYDGGQTTDKFFADTISNANANNELYLDMSGQTIKTADFKHNNMMPYFGAKIKGQLANYDANEQKLDAMTGSGSQLIKKQEQAPLFKPHDNMSFANGAPNESDFYQSRINPSLKMSNIKPFQSEQVAPGLNLGYNNLGAHNSLEERSTYMPKTVDELRVLTNPKCTFTLDGHMGPANSYSRGEVGSIGVVEKKTPDQSYENTKDRWLKTTGSYLKDTTRSVHINKVENRTTTTVDYDGIAYGGQAGVNYDQTVYQKSDRNEYCSPEFTPAVHATGNALGTGSYNILKNNRSYDPNNPNEGQFGIVGSAIGAVVSPLMNVLKPSRKENVVGNIRLHGNVQSHVPDAYLPNENNLKVTNRQMQALSNNHLNVQGQGSGAYAYENFTDVGAFKDDLTKEYFGISNSNTGQYSHLSSENQLCNVSKEITSYNRMPIGNAKSGDQLNSKQLCVKRENDRMNNRMWVPSQSGAQLTPSVQMQGSMNQPTPQQTTDNRLNPDLLEAFKQNPFTHSFNSVA